MPKLGKQTKVELLRAMIKGLREHLDEREPIVMNAREYSLPALVALFEKQLRAIAKVQRLTIELETAIAQERDGWEAIQPEVRGVRRFAKGRLGPQNPSLHDLGVVPEREPHMSAEAKDRANEKRQRTREARGIVGKRRRAKR